MRPLLFLFGFLSSHDIAQGIQRGKGWWGTRWDTQGKATAVIPDNAARDSLLTWKGGRDIFACRSVSDRIRPYLFPFGFLPPKLWDIKPRGNGKPWGDGACRRRYGRPERERSYKTSLFLLWLFLHPIPLPGSQLPV